MIITADRILTGEKNGILKGMSACITDGKIVKIAPEQELRRLYPAEPVENYSGCTLMPGMIDLHTHPSLCPNPAYKSSAQLTAFALYRFEQTLKNGVTTIRDCASGGDIITAIKKAAADGYARAPRIFTCLQGICITGGHGSALHGPCVECDGEWEVRKAVRRNIRDGADCIKILTSEGYRGVEMNQDEIDAAVDEAHRLGRKIAAHTGYGESIEMCIKAGCDSIEHGTHLTIEQAKYMKEHNQTFVPTVYIFFMSYDDAVKDEKTLRHLQETPSVMKYLNESLECYRNNLRALYDTGVRICTGTDTDLAPRPIYSPVASECEYMVRCGLTPMEVIECATKNCADYLDMGDCLGQIREGYIADVILVEGNPSEDISALHKVKAVFQSGKQIV